MDHLKKVLVITDSDSLQERLSEVLSGSFYHIRHNDMSIKSIFIIHKDIEMILIDFIVLSDFKKNLPIEFYVERLELLREICGDVPVLVLVDHKQVDDAGRLLKAGFQNLIQIPFSKDVLLHQLNMEEDRLRNRAVMKGSNDEIVSPKNIFFTKNQEFSQVLDRVEQVAKSKTTILISGESGTGKSLLAKYIHYLSGRSDFQFVDVHCGAIPEGLVESELFGHEKGAFTGAIKKKIGKFEMSHKGTVFLDEIGTVSKAIQVKMLQVLQERFIQRVGGEANISLDIRVIAATNDNLKELVSKGEFREDLFYRLNVFHIDLPPLRNRMEDIPNLCLSILEKLNALYGKEIKEISGEVLSIFSNYDWPGNIRELENILERAYVLELGSEITPSNIPRELIPVSKDVLSISPLDRKSIGLVEARREATDSFEKKYLTELLIAHNGKVSQMAKEADVSIRQIHKLMAKHSIKPKSFSIQLSEEEL